MSLTVAYQGEEGAYSHSACLQCFPDGNAQGYASFEDVFAAASHQDATYALIPVENSIAGRVAEIHQILAHAQLHAVGEHFHPIHHHLLSQKDTPFDAITHVASHMQALAQCRSFLQKHKLTPIPTADTAVAAREVAQGHQTHIAAIASHEAATIHRLTVQKKDIQDTAINVTRFLILSVNQEIPSLSESHVITSLVFHTNNEPAALYNALGGLARERINLTRLEGMVKDQTFHQAAFYLDMETHKDDPAFQKALADMKPYADSIRIIGCYPASPYRGRAS